MFCIDCGARIDDAVKFCPSCGTSTDPLTVNDEGQLKKNTQSRSSSNNYLWAGCFFIGILIIWNISNGTFGSNSAPKVDPTITDFKASEVGKGLLACVASTGDITFKTFDSEKAGKVVEVNINKSNKEVRMQFSYRKDPQQINLVGAQVKGEADTSKFSLMLTLELLCGGPNAAKILPEDYQNMQQMNGLRNMFR
jgi:hypothetical protein